jgi:hypothetical protein
MNAVNKWSGGTSFNRDALIEACQRVVHAKPYLVGVRCENSSLFNGQMNDLIKNCESQLELYKSFIKPEPERAPAPAPVGAKAAEPAIRSIGVND